jgi:hypothetical protein
MASNSDAAYVEDVDVDLALRARNNAAQAQSHTAPVYRPDQPYKSGATSPGLDSDNEDAPLLSPTSQDYGSGDGGNGGSRSNRRSSDYEYEWEGQADFEGLSWRKKPSVRTQSQ